MRDQFWNFVLQHEDEALFKIAVIVISLFQVSSQAGGYPRNLGKLEGDSVFCMKNLTALRGIT